MQMHLEFFVDDLEATGARVLAAGATRFGYQPNADHCFVYAGQGASVLPVNLGVPKAGD